MSMLARYKKPGGFSQLVFLIETCHGAKRDQLMKIVREEDPKVADLVENKVLTAARIWSWSEEIIAVFFEDVPEKVLWASGYKMENGIKRKILNLIKEEQYRVDLVEWWKSEKPKTGEVEAANIKLVNIVRTKAKAGFVDLKKIDPALDLEISLKFAS